MKQNVLFVCMGNICRSPTAEGVFRAQVTTAGLQDVIHVDSAGTHDYHIGRPPDPRSIAAATMRGYDIAGLSARLVTVEDFSRFDWILAMDDVNLAALGAMRPRTHAGHLGLMLDLEPELGERHVPDPYYQGKAAFDRVIDLVEPASAALLARVRERIPGR